MATDNDISSMGRVAVTGATGMVGSHLVAELLRDGCSHIVLVVRDATRLSATRATLARLGVEPQPGAVEVAECRLSDAGELSRRLSDIDTVFNCAGRIMAGGMDAGELIDNNVSIARAVSEWCLAIGVKRLVHVNSISALGEPPSPDVPVTEECTASDISHYAAYGQSKYLSEREVWRAAGAGLPVTVVSPGVILGEGDKTAGNSAALIPAISWGLPFYTDGLMSYVDVRDVARAMVLLGSEPRAAGERFILSAGNMSYRELITAASRAAHRPAPFIRIGRGAVETAYRLMRLLVTSGIVRDRGISRENLGSLLRTTRYDGSKVTRLCGFEYTPLQETISRVVEYYRRK